MLPAGKWFRRVFSPRDPPGAPGAGPGANKKDPPAPAGNTVAPPNVASTQPTVTSTSQETKTTTTTPPAVTSTTVFSSSTILSTSTTSSSSSSPITTSTTSTPLKISSFTTPLTFETSTSLSTTSVAFFSLTSSPTTLSIDATSSSSSVGTTFQTTFAGTSTSAVATNLVSPTTNTVAKVRQNGLGPGQKAGIAVGVIVLVGCIAVFLLLFFRRRRDRSLDAITFVPQRRQSGRASSAWSPSWSPWYRGGDPAEAADSLLTAESGPRSSLGWDYTATFAPQIETRKSKRSFRKSFEKLVQFSQMKDNPDQNDVPRGGTPGQNSSNSNFWGPSTNSSPDQESPPALHTKLSPPPPLPVFPPQVFVSHDSSDTNRPQSVLADVLPPEFHRSWCYRNSHASVASDARSFASVPEWVKFHYPRRSQSAANPLRQGHLSAPHPRQAVSSGSWFKTKILRRSQSTTASGEEEGTQIRRDSSNDTSEKLDGRKMGRRISYESVSSLDLEKQI